MSRLASHLSAIKMANAEKRYVSNAGARKFFKKAYNHAVRTEGRLTVKKLAESALAA